MYYGMSMECLYYEEKSNQNVTDLLSTRKHTSSHEHREELIVVRLIATLQLCNS